MNLETETISASAIILNKENSVIIDSKYLYNPIFE